MSRGKAMRPFTGREGLCATAAIWAILLLGCWNCNLHASDISESNNSLRQALAVQDVNPRDALLALNKIKGQLKPSKSDKSGELVALIIDAKVAQVKERASGKNSYEWVDSYAKLITEFLNKNYLEVSTGLGGYARLISESAKWMAVAGNHAQAIGLLDEKAKAAGAEDQVLYLIALSQVLSCKDNWEEAVKFASRAVNTANSLYTSGNQEEVDELRLSASGNYERLSRLRDIAIHGLGYRLYYEANIQRLQLNHPEKALGIYSKILVLSANNQSNPRRSVPLIWLDASDIDQMPIHPIYSAAARNGVIQCLDDQGTLKTKIKDPTLEHYFSEKDSPFYPANVTSLGYAYLAMGDAKSAKSAFAEALRWIASPSVNPAYDIPEQSKNKTQPHGDMRTIGQMNRVGWFQPRPNEIYTIHTCKWLADYYSMQSYLGLAMISYIDGGKEEALSHLSNAMRFDQFDVSKTERGTPSNFLRLRDGIQRGRFYGTAEELRCFQGDKFPMAIIAEWAFECERWQEALTRYDELAKTPGLSVEANAYLDYARGCALLFMDRKKEALIKLTEFSVKSSKYKNTPSFPRAIFALASTKDKPDEIADFLLNSLPSLLDKEYRIRALLKIGQSLAYGPRNAEGIKYLQQALVLLPKADDPRANAVASLIRDMQNPPPVQQPAHQNRTIP